MSKAMVEACPKCGAEIRAGRETRKIFKCETALGNGEIVVRGRECIAAVDARLAAAQVELEQAKAEAEELRESERDWWLTFGIQHSAEMRGIRAWQKETGKQLTMPDTACFVVWLIKKLDAAGLLGDPSAPEQ